MVVDEQGLHWSSSNQGRDRSIMSPAYKALRFGGDRAGERLWTRAVAVATTIVMKLRWRVRLLTRCSGQVSLAVHHIHGLRTWPTWTQKGLKRAHPTACFRSWARETPYFNLASAGAGDRIEPLVTP